MTTAATHQEIQQAKAHIEANGYQAATHENGHLIVQDPVMRCGHGATAGQLVPAGFQPVAIRSYREALRFVMARS